MMSLSLNKFRQHLIIAQWLWILALATGCASFNLDEVHRTYREEFATRVIGLTQANNEAPPEIEETNLFPKTLSAIQHFQAKYSDKTNALKHLAVLQAMIYLQSRQYGTARLVLQSDAVKNGKLETSDGELLRDELFYNALTAIADDIPAGLIEAWEAIDKKLLRQDPNDLNHIGNTLSKLASDAVEMKKVPKGDDGAVYIAGTAAICYFHAADAARRLWKPPQGLSDEEKKHQRRQRGLPYYERAMIALEPHLTDEEKNADQDELAKLAQKSTRYEFVQLYHRARGLVNELKGNP